MSAASSGPAPLSRRGGWWRRLVDGEDGGGRSVPHELNRVLREKRCMVALGEEFLGGPGYVWARPTVRAYIAAEEAMIALVEEVIRDAGGFPTVDAAPVPAARTQRDALSAAWEKLRGEIDRCHALMQWAEDEGEEQVRRLLHNLLAEARRWDTELRRMLMKM
ncbi:MAG: hypothetical protein HYY96_01705 [Candidatus Tectomicrobia bacterium]|nr:hypothetical protein [Candidatus Tectomicrobia bacterium]